MTALRPAEHVALRLAALLGGRHAICPCDGGPGSGARGRSGLLPGQRAPAVGGPTRSSLPRVPGGVRLTVVARGQYWPPHHSAGRYSVEVRGVSEADLAENTVSSSRASHTKEAIKPHTATSFRHAF